MAATEVVLMLCDNLLKSTCVLLVKAIALKELL